MIRENTELCIHAVSAKRWQVIERPITDPTVSIPQDQIKLLVTVQSKKEAILFAEGRQSATGQPIRVI